ncbi:MAG TPA: enoyl-CoA hydratase/isomerase family protein [Rhizomicrobium sp.]|jgi:enoyl-CoA hydratase/carnithine racemase|nr:enoyl-CoA hydratase/isomerase family protein [Rhizomicrobium sp.]
MAAYKTLIVEKRGRVDWLTLNRPERLNTITGTMVQELNDYFRGLKQDFETRIVVMRGAGRGFCAGLDIKEYNTPGGDRPKDGAGRAVAGDHLFDIVEHMRACPQPIVALVHGPACGGGFAFALAADIRVVGESARMNDAFVALGRTGCELGLTYFLPRIVGLGIAAELMLTGDFIDGPRAKQVGLASDCVQDDQLEAAAEKYLKPMLRTAPLGLRLTKETLNTSLRIADLRAVIDLEERAQSLCARGPDFDEAMKAFLEKREPHYG